MRHRDFFFFPLFVTAIPVHVSCLMSHIHFLTQSIQGIGYYIRYLQYIHSISDLISNLEVEVAPERLRELGALKMKDQFR
jgi:hypothetical protein